MLTWVVVTNTEVYRTDEQDTIAAEILAEAINQWYKDYTSYKLEQIQS